MNKFVFQMAIVLYSETGQVVFMYVKWAVEFDILILLWLFSDCLTQILTTFDWKMTESTFNIEVIVKKRLFDIYSFLFNGILISDDHH